MKYSRLFLFFAAISPMMASAPAMADTTVPSRTIHLVYDDSGSMIKQGSTYVDTWCQAKYAIEVVAAMLGERDTLNVYYMSDYDTDTQAQPRIRLHGSRNAKTVAGNVETIHNTVTKFGNTPFNAVRKATADLNAATADERWLVVLTDGEFEDGKMTSLQVENYYADVVKEGRNRVIMLAMGPEAAKIQADEEKGIYFEHAATTEDILPRLTALCNRIFQRNALKVIENNRNYKIDFGVPMKQLIVFAQGRDAKIGDYIVSGDRRFELSSNVHAAYSTQSSEQNPPGAVIADNLNGYVATFDGEFGPGTYQLDVKDADSIEVYYKPNVAIHAYLYDADGVEVTDKSDIVNGQYKLEFGFVDASNQAKVEDTSLLGRIEYISTVTNTAADGTVHTVNASSGDQIALREGKIDIDVTAHYLDYNAVHTKLSFDVFFRNELTFKLEETPKYTLTKDGLSHADLPIIVTVQMKDGDHDIALNPEQWEAMNLPKVTAKEGPLGEFRIEKGDRIGEFKLYPTLSAADPFEVQPGAYEFALSGGFSRGKSSAAGRLENRITIGDDITAIERMINWWKQHWKAVVEILAGIILIIGYAKKKRFSKKMAKLPMIEENDRKDRGRRKKKGQPLSGTFKKKLGSCLLPFVSEEGELDMGVGDCPRMHLTAAKFGRVQLDSNFVRNNWKELKLDDEKIDNPEEDNPSKIKYTADDLITYISGSKEYTCHLKTDIKDIDREE